MKKSWKVGLLSSLLLTPAAVVLVEQPVQATTDANEQRAIEYFRSLNLGSSMADYSLYTDLLNKAFPMGENTTNPQDPAKYKFILMNEKLNYIKEYNELKLIADSLKTEISKLTLTNKTLIKNYEEADVKYKSLLMDLERINTSLKNAELGVSDPAYDDLLSNIGTYTKLATELVTELIGSNNQNLLAVRGTQIANVTKKTNDQDLNYLELVELINNATTKAEYDTNLPKAKLKYASFTTDEKAIADNQLAEGTTVTVKQAMTTAEGNVAKAAAFDRDADSIASINISSTDEASITQLKTKLVALDKAYNALTPIQKQLISSNSQQIVQPFQELLTISGKINALKADNTPGYREAIETIEGEIANLQDIPLGTISIDKEIVKRIVPYLEKLTAAKADILAVKVVEKKITDLKGTDTNPNVPTLIEIQAARSAFNALTTNQKKIVMHLDELTNWENADKNSAAVDKKIEAITISAKADFYNRFAEAKAAYDKLNPTVAAIYVTKKNRLLSLQPYAEIVNEITLLKVTDADYATKLATLLATLDTELNPNSEWSDAKIDALPGLSDEDKVQLKATRQILYNQKSATDAASDLVGKIDGLVDANPNHLIANVVAYRAIYNSLDSTTKKLVTNIKTLTEYEKANKVAVNVMKQIDNLDPMDSKFVNLAVSARKNYDKLSASLKPLIASSHTKLVEMEKISNVMLEIDNLKKSRNILEDANKATENYDTLKAYLTGKEAYAEVLTLLETTYAPKLTIAKERYDAVTEVVQKINQLAINTTSQTVGENIKDIATAYKELSSSDKKLVTNYSTYKTIEKDYKAALKVFNLIENLPSQESSDYTKKVEGALKAYLMLNSAQAQYVFNYNTKLKPFIGVASIIGEIDQLKSSMKDFVIVVTDLRTRYDALTSAEQEKIHNYQKLVAAESALLGAENVIKLIQQARPGVENYLDALQVARDAYDALSSDQKKQVTNYKELQNREKAVKPIMSLNDLILKIGSQSSAKNFISNYDKAWKELEKISLQDRVLLTNEKLLTETYLPLYNVMNRIESIKATSKTFVDDVKDVRAVYEALTPDQKTKILNVDLLREHEVNVQGGAYVDELIRALKSNPPALYVQKVQEAEEAYKNLSSANKKAVTLYEELKVELKYIAPVVQAIQAIDLLETSGGKLDAQVKKVNSILAKLTDEQYSLIPNLDKLNNLGNVIQVVNLIELIKPSDTKYYIGNTKAAEIAYNRLSADEKQKVSNYSKLEEALLNVVALDQITKKINELSNLSSTYVDDVNNLLDEYKKLPSALKKQVSNYGSLEQAKKDVDAANKVIRVIAAIDSSVRTFESKVLSARKEYDKLTDNQKTLVSNARLLLQYERELGL